MIQFTLNDKQEARLRKWQRTHDCKYREDGFVRYSGNVAGADKFIFMDTKLGRIGAVYCICGKKIDFSDFD